MKAVFLAAGIASRLRPLTDHTPKAILPVHGVPMMRRSMQHLYNAGIRDFVIVTGYLEDKLKAAVAAWFPGLPVAYVSNPDYATKGNATSLLVARHLVEDHDFILLDGDLIYEAGVVTDILGHPAPTSTAMRPSDSLGEEEMKVIVDAAGNVARISKQLPPRESVGESIGINRFSAAASRPLLDIMHDRVNNRGHVQDYYEDSIQELVTSGRGTVGVVNLGTRYCAEIDTAADLGHVEAQLAALGWPRE